jgi:hypothetical protein
MSEKCIIEINGVEYEVPDNVADEVYRLRDIENAARVTQLVMSQISILIRAVAARQG